MRTTLDISDALIKEAMAITGAKTKSQVITEALEAQIKRSKRQRLLKFKGKIDLDIDLEASRQRK